MTHSTDSKFEWWEVSDPEDSWDLWKNRKDDLYGDTEGRCDDNAWGSVPAYVDGSLRAIRGICVGCDLPLDRCDCGDQ